MADKKPNRDDDYMSWDDDAIKSLVIERASNKPATKKDSPSVSGNGSNSTTKKEK